MSQDRAFAAWEDLRRRVEALESRLPVPVFEPCACKEVTLARGQLEKVTDSRYTRTTHYRECCNRVSPIPKPAPVSEWRRLVNDAAQQSVDANYALGDALGLLQRIAYPINDQYTPAHLARIIAVAEGQVGGGWQADPEVELVGSVWVLLSMFTDQDPRLLVPEQPERARWMNLGNYAAAWLKAITEDEAS